MAWLPCLMNSQLQSGNSKSNRLWKNAEIYFKFMTQNWRNGSVHQSDPYAMIKVQMPHPRAKFTFSKQRRKMTTPLKEVSYAQWQELIWKMISQYMSRFYERIALILILIWCWQGQASFKLKTVIQALCHASLNSNGRPMAETVNKDPESQCQRVCTNGVRDRTWSRSCCGTWIIWWGWHFGWGEEEEEEESLRKPRECHWWCHYYLIMRTSPSLA